MMGTILAILALTISFCVTVAQTDGLTFTREQPSRSETPSQGTSEVEAILSGTTWVTSVKVGGQVLRVQIDTGSSDFWVVSTLADDETKANYPNHNYFDPSKSSTWQLQPDLKFNSTYDVGEEGAFGIVGTETVELGGVTVTNMLIGAATHVFGGIGALDPTYDGIMGLGWSSSSEDFVSSNGSFTEAPSFIQTVQSQLKEPVFTCDFRANAPETISFGFVNSSLYTGTLSKLSIDNSTGDWLVNNVTFSSSEKELGLPAGLTVIFDTGGLDTTVDAQTAKDYWSLVSGSNMSSAQNWTFPCNTAVLPDLTLMFPDGVNVTLPGSALNQTASSEDGITCTGGLQTARNGVYNVGYSFFQSYFTVWNQQESSLSFAPYSNIQDTAGSNDGNLPTATNVPGFPMPTGPISASPTGVSSHSTTATSMVSSATMTVIPTQQNTAGKTSDMLIFNLVAIAMLIWIL